MRDSEQESEEGKEWKTQNEMDDSTKAFIEMRVVNLSDNKGNRMNNEVLR